jgi:hypothetical protein
VVESSEEEMQNAPNTLSLSETSAILLGCPYLSIWLRVLWTTRDKPTARRKLRIAFELMYLHVEDEDWGDPQVVADPE